MKTEEELCLEANVRRYLHFPEVTHFLFCIMGATKKGNIAVKKTPLGSNERKLL
jgi:hypothetical protein